MAGRPRYEPKPADRETVKALSAAGVPQARIAKCIGDYGVDEKTLRKHFRRELDVSSDLLTAHTMGKLLAAINESQPWAVLSWLKCRAGWAETQRVDQRFVDSEGKDRALDIGAVRAYMKGSDDPSEQE